MPFHLLCPCSCHDPWTSYQMRSETAWTEMWCPSSVTIYFKGQQGSSNICVIACPLLSCALESSGMFTPLNTSCSRSPRILENRLAAYQVSTLPCRECFSILTLLEAGARLPHMHMQGAGGVCCRPSSACGRDCACRLCGAHLQLGCVWWQLHHTCRGDTGVR